MTSSMDEKKTFYISGFTPINTLCCTVWSAKGPIHPCLGRKSSAGAVARRLDWIGVLSLGLEAAVFDDAGPGLGVGVFAAGQLR